MSLLDPATSSPNDEEKRLGFRPVSPTEESHVEQRLGTLVADRAFTERPDREFQEHVRNQFDKVFPEPKHPLDAGGKRIRPRAATTGLDSFKPQPDPQNAPLRLSRPRTAQCTGRRLGAQEGVVGGNRQWS